MKSSSQIFFFQIIWHSNCLTLSVTDGGYSRNASCASQYIYLFIQQLFYFARIAIMSRVLDLLALKRLLNDLIFQSFNYRYKRTK